jgi:hypothetical protein
VLVLLLIGAGYPADERNNAALAFMRSPIRGNCALHRYLCKGLWNERPWGTVPFVKDMRAQMDAAGLQATRLVLWDGGVPAASDGFWGSVDTDPGFAGSFDAVRNRNFACVCVRLRACVCDCCLGFFLLVVARQTWPSRKMLLGRCCWLDMHDDTLMPARLKVGMHYPCDGKAEATAPLREQYGKKVWASEDWWSEAEW